MAEMGAAYPRARHHHEQPVRRRRSLGRYLTDARKATAPKIEAIAVTDYYVTDTYEEVLNDKACRSAARREAGLPERRAAARRRAAKAGFVNVHLFVSPEDPEHVEEVQRILSRLQIQRDNDRFDCTRAELISFGKRADPT